MIPDKTSSLYKPSTIPFPLDMSVLGFSATEQAGRDQVLTQLAQRALAPDESLGFLEVHDRLRKLEAKGELSSEAKELTDRIRGAAYHFERVLVGSETQSLTAESVQEMEQVRHEFQMLRSELEKATPEGLSDRDISLLRKDFGKECQKVENAVPWLQFQSHFAPLQASIAQQMENVAVHQQFGLGVLSPTDSYQHFQALMESLGELLDLYQDVYLPSRDTNVEGMNLAIVESLEKSITLITLAVSDYGQAFQQMMSERDTGLYEDHELLQKMMTDMGQVLDKLNERKSATGGLLQSIGDVVTHPGRMVTGIFSSLLHPLETTQKVLNRIEQLSPMPAYTATGLIPKAEKRIAQELRMASDVLQENSDAVKRLSTRVDQQENPLTTQSVAAEVIDGYRGILNRLAEKRATVSALKSQLEAMQDPTEEQLDAAEDLASAIDTLCSDIGQLVDAKNLPDGVSAAQYSALQEQAQTLRQDMDDMMHLLMFRFALGQLQGSAEERMLALTDQTLKLVQGQAEFSGAHDLQVIHAFQQIIDLSGKALRPDIPLVMQKEIAKKLQTEWGNLSFARNEHIDEFQEAFAAAVTKQRLGQGTSEEKNQLLQEVEVAQRGLGWAKIRLEAYQQIMLSEAEADSEATVAMSNLIDQLLKDIEGEIHFFEQQRGLLVKEEGPGLMEQALGRMQLRGREKGVEHTARILRGEEGWSERAKGIGNLVFSLLQLSPSLIYAGSVLSGQEAATLRRYADDMHRQVVDKVSDTAKDAADRDVGYLGTILTTKGKYQQLYQEYARIGEVGGVARRSVPVQEALKAMFGRYGDTLPSRESISYLLKDFQTGLLMQAASIEGVAGYNPTAHMSLGEWWKAFTQAEEEKVFPPAKPLMLSDESGTRPLAELDVNRPTIKTNAIASEHLQKTAANTPESVLSAMAEERVQIQEDAEVAIGQQESEITDVAASQGIPIDTKTDSRAAILNLAAIEGNTAAVQGLLEAGVDPNIPDKDGLTPLHSAVKNGHADVLALLLEDPRIQIDAKTSDGDTALKWAAEQDRLDIVEQLLKAGADPSIANNYGWTAFHTSAWKGHADVLAVLLRHEGIQIDAKTSDGGTALNRAAYEGNAGIVEQLLKAGADPNIADDGGRMALHRTAWKGHADVLAVLLQDPRVRKQIDAKTSDGDTALMWAVLEGNAGIVEQLLKVGADPSIANNVGWTALHRTAWKGHADVLAVLLQDPRVRKQIDAKTSDGRTALYCAAYEGNAYIVEQLLKAGADPSIANNVGWTALHSLAWKGHADVLAVLLRHEGMQIDAKARDGRTALYCAAEEGKLDIVERLLQAGADQSIAADNRYTPLVSCKVLHPAKECLRVFGGDLHSQEYLFQKLLAHAWEIGGTAEIYGQQIKRKGMLGSPYFSHHMLQSLKEFQQRYPKELSLEDGKLLEGVLAMGSRTLRDEEIPSLVNGFHKERPISIHTGFVGHAIEVFLWGDLIVINNKGGATRAPIEVFEIDSEKVDEGVIREIDELGGKEWSYYIQWLEALPETLDAQESPLGDYIVRHYPFSHEQRVGNCAWESVETSVYALLAIKRLGVDFDPSKVENNNVIEEVNRVFEGWLQFTQLNALDDYLTSHELDGSPLDKGLVWDVLRQAWSVSAWRIDLHEKMVDLEEQFTATLKPWYVGALKTDRVCAWTNI